MADKKISALTASTTPLAGTEVLPIVQSGATVKVSVANLTAGRAVSASSLTASTDNVIIGTTAKGVTTGSAIPLGLGVNNTVTAITIDTSSNVGIGTTAPAGNLEVSSSSSTTIRNTVKNAGTAGADDLALWQSFLTGLRANYMWSNSSYLFGLASNNGSALTTEAGVLAASKLVMDTNGNVGIGTVSPAEKLDVVGKIKLSDNVVIGTAAKGIDFSANTGAAGMTSELLDWYEEGTWTPNQGGGLTVVGAFSSSGKYTRIGQQITVTGQVNGATSVLVSASGIISTNLPYASGIDTLGVATDSALSVVGGVFVSAGSANLFATVAIGATPAIYFQVTYFV